MSEANLRYAFRDHMSPYGRVQRIESPMEKGTPDACVCLRSGRTVAGINAGTLTPKEHPGKTTWVEYKYQEKWPRDPMGRVKVRSFCEEADKLEQVTWAETWTLAGGNYVMLLHISDTYALLPPDLVRPLYYQRLLRVDIARRALVFAKGPPFPTRELLKCLT